MKIAPNILSILAAMAVSGSTATLQGNLSRADYLATNEVLETLNFKWDRRAKCHRTNGDAQAALATVLEAPTPEIYTGKEKKKDFQFFPTPSELADTLVQALQWDSWKPATVLETSAGQGALIFAINRWLPTQVVDCYELMDENREVLKTIPTANLLGEDFFKRDMAKTYDCIIQNPPFSRMQDIDFIKSAYESLNDGGRMVSVCGNGWQNSTRKKAIAFNAWLEEVNATVFPIASGTFKSSGTMVGASYITFWKI